MSNIIELSSRFAARAPAAVLPPENIAEVKKLPYEVSRRIHSRKPRRSKNGTPEERAEKQPVHVPYVGRVYVTTARGGDPTFVRIAQHRDAVSRHDRAVTEEYAAEEQKVAPERLEELREHTNAARDHMMEVARIMLLDPPTTARGLARLSFYVSCLHDIDDVHDSSPYLPEKINGEPWLLIFLRTVGLASRRIGRKTRGASAGSTLPEFLTKLKGYLRQEMQLGKSLDQALDDLASSTMETLRARS
jgi:hypothetical protein